MIFLVVIAFTALTNCLKEISYIKNKHARFLSYILILIQALQSLLIPILSLSGIELITESLLSNLIIYGINETAMMINIYAFIIITSLISIFIKIIKQNIVHTAFSKKNSAFKYQYYIDYLLCLLGIVFTLYYLKTISAIPIIELFKGVSPGEVLKLRTAVTSGYSGKLHWIKLFTYFIPLFQISSLIIRSRFFSLVSFINLLIILWSSLMATEKAPIVYAVLLIMITFTFINKKPIRFAIVNAAAMLVLIVGLVTVLGTGSFNGIFHIAYLTFERILVTPFKTNGNWLEYKILLDINYFDWPFLNIKNILPLINIDISKQVYALKYPEMFSNHYYGSIPSSSLYTYIVYDGIIGVLLWSLKVLSIFSLLIVTITRIKPSSQILFVSWTVWTVAIAQGFDPNIFISLYYICPIALLFSLDLLTRYKVPPQSEVIKCP